MKVRIPWCYSEYDFDVKSSDRISTLKERINDRDHFRGNMSLYHKERELLDSLLVKDYAVESGDIFEIKKERKHSRESLEDDDYGQEIRRLDERSDSTFFEEEERERIDEIRDDRPRIISQSIVTNDLNSMRRNLPPDYEDIGEFGTHIDSPGRELLVD